MGGVRKPAPFLLAAAALAIASPAAANPLGDCFERVASMVHHRPHPVVHRIHQVGSTPHRAHRTGAVRRRVAYSRPGYGLRPIACETHPVALMSATPGAVGPETANTVIAELVGPMPAIGAGVDVSTLAPEALPVLTPDVGGFLGGGPVGGLFPVEPVGPVGGGGPPVVVIPGGIPEPGVWGLMTAGFFGLGGVLRRQRAARQRLETGR